ncbi:Bax inhibitor-1 family protein [Gammaproteobacteria bacterium]|nr:Bax inhibitor-1 family protein [Gammaproteobacteria bacterium]
MAQSGIQTGSGAELATNRVLRNTYRLLAMTLAFASVVALGAMAFNLPHPGMLVQQFIPIPFASMLITLAMWFGLLFMIEKNKNSANALVWVFAFAGFTGWMAGAMIQMYLAAYSNGYQLVASALGSTAVTFFGASYFVRATGKDFGGITKTLMLAILAFFVAGIIGAVFQLPTVMLLVSGGFAVLMTFLIMWQTSEIIHGRETNYISATVTLYVSIYNLFTSLLMIFGIFGDE